MIAYDVQELTDQQFLCAEGPVWDSKRNLFYWTECEGDGIYCYKQQENKSALYCQGITAASLLLHENGGLVTCGRDGFSFLSIEGELDTFNSVADGIPVNNLNDIIADPQGCVFSGQQSFSEEKEYETGYLFRLDKHGHSKIMAEGLHLSNGMGFSPDCSKFYLVDTILGVVYHFDYDISSGDIRNKNILVRIDKTHGAPDGMTVDNDGFLWVAMFFGSKIIRLDPDGVVEREINLPCTQPTSLTFGGKNMNELFITSGNVEWNTRHFSTPPGYRIRGGNIYRIETDFQGRPEFPALI